MGAWLEHLFAAGHDAWWGRWELWQLVAIVTGGVVLLRATGRHALRPFAIGLLVAVLGALAFGGGLGWASWLAARRGPPPEIELAGTGALVGLALGFVLASGRRGISPARALDELAYAVGPMLATARGGCFFAGCDYGAPSDAPWAIRYPQGTAAFAGQSARGLIAPGDAWTLPVHPVQLYELAAGVALAFVATAPTRGPAGARMARVLVSFAVLRACTDLARGDLARGAWGVTSTQWLALAIVGAATSWRASRLHFTPP